ncbi:MAG: hypothetical protein JAY98_03500 [Candidatus Thiodiazotropha lotti]|nr:hypothetical protein [Candidatus Thiodiazotropha lotti]MCW4182239.1 hypothetical protein [Candidatus Thiodiazotropha weberae]
MRLEVIAPGQGRTWKCTNNSIFSTSDSCYFCKEIPGDHTLSILEIAGSFRASSGFSSSDELKKDQANIRRILGGLKKLRLQPYMSDEETQALATIFNLLERFGDAAEKAKKLKIEEEKAEKARRGKRATQASDTLRQRYDAKDLRELVINGIAITKTSSFSVHLTPDRLVTIQKNAEHSFSRSYDGYRYVINEVRCMFDSAIDQIASDIAFNTSPLDEDLATAIAQIDELRKRQYPGLEIFFNWLAEQKIIEANSDKITRLCRNNTVRRK